MPHHGVSETRVQGRRSRIINDIATMTPWDAMDAGIITEEQRRLVMYQINRLATGRGDVTNEVITLATWLIVNRQQHPKAEE